MVIRVKYELLTYIMAPAYLSSFIFYDSSFHALCSNNVLLISLGYFKLSPVSGPLQAVSST